MKTILFTTDVSGFELCPDPVLVVIPANRMNTEKIRLVVVHVRKNDIPFHLHVKGYVDPLVDIIKTSGAEFGISWLSSQIFEKDIIDVLNGKIVNYHGGPLATTHTLRKAVKNGETSMRVMWHWMIEALDEGPVIMEGHIPVTDWEESRKALIEKGIEMYRKLQLEGIL